MERVATDGKTSKPIADITPIRTDTDMVMRAMS
jgi:hypothetical protein